MSVETVMDTTRLAAFVDGELSPEASAEVVMHLADHPQDQAYVDELMAANEALAQAFAAPLTDPVPDRITQTIMGKPPSAEIIPLRRRPSIWVGTALAASVALAVVAIPGLMAPTAGGDLLAIGSVAPGSDLAQTLDTLPSGTPADLGDAREVMVLATLPTEAGFCREVEVIDHSAAQIDLAIACRDAEGWAVQVTLSEPLSAAGTADGFVAASGAEVQGLEPFLERLGAGAALDPASEAAAIAKGWQP